MTRVLVVGVDPGATTGICALAFPPVVTHQPGEPWHARDVIVLECTSADSSARITEITDAHPGYEIILAVEKFVVSGRAGRSATAAAGHATRELIAYLGYVYDTVHVRPAVTVKLWATDKRLQAAGLYAPTRGRPHARDAARHALFTAVRSGVTRDPLSTAAV